MRFMGVSPGARHKRALILAELRDWAVTVLSASAARDHERKLREIVLARGADGVYGLSFFLADPDAPTEGVAPAADRDAEIPEYVMVEETV